MTDEQGDAVEGAKGGRLLLFVTFLLFAWMAVGPGVIGWLMRHEGVNFSEFLRWSYVSPAGALYHFPAACCALLALRRRGTTVLFGAVAMAFSAVNVVIDFAESGWNSLGGAQLMWLVVGAILLVKLRRRTRDGVIT